MSINLNEGGRWFTFYHVPGFSRLYLGLPIRHRWAHWSKVWSHK